VGEKAKEKILHNYPPRQRYPVPRTPLTLALSPPRGEGREGASSFDVPLANERTLGRGNARSKSSFQEVCNAQGLLMARFMGMHQNRKK
jgi:hypothetical protein